MVIKERLGLNGKSDIQRDCDPTKNRGPERGSGVMRKAAYAVCAAAIVAAAFVATLSLSAQVEARGSLPGAKTDRADTRPLARDCSRNAWPYFEANCLRDTRNSFGQARNVRLVSADRLTPVGAR
jgi:hypothetical protein